MREGKEKNITITFIGCDTFFSCLFHRISPDSPLKSMHTEHYHIPRFLIFFLVLFFSLLLFSIARRVVCDNSRVVGRETFAEPSPRRKSVMKYELGIVVDTPVWQREKERYHDPACCNAFA